MNNQQTIQNKIKQSDIGRKVYYIPKCCNNNIDHPRVQIGTIVKITKNNSIGCLFGNIFAYCNENSLTFVNL